MPVVPQALRHRDYARMWAGQSLSVLGDGIYTVAIAFEALHLRNHASTLAYVEAARIAPSALLLIFAGALVDRLPRRMVVLSADLVRAGTVAALAGLAATGALTVMDLVCGSVVVGCADAFFYPAYQAIMPELLPTELLIQGNAFNTASRTIGASFLGPALGGLIVAVAGTATAFAIDAGTFVVSALCLVTMAHIPAPASTGRSVASDARAGLRWTMHQRWLWYGLLAVGVSEFAAFSPLAVTIPLLVRNVLHHGPAAYGATLAAGGAGGLLATALAAQRGSPARRVSWIWGAWAAASVALIAVGLAPDVVVLAAGTACSFFGITYGNLIWASLMQTAVPPELLGRASSVDYLLSICLSPLGIIVAGVLAGSIGVRETVLLGAGLATVSCLVVFVPGVRDPDRPDYQPAPVSE